MKFKSLTNIESASLFGIVFLCACTVLTCYGVWWAYALLIISIFCRIVLLPFLPKKAR